MKVCIDPGHGGYDPGAVGFGLKEKDLTLDICLRLQPLLEFNGISTVLTRNGDYAPGNFENYPRGELGARVNIAESENVDLFVSVHINAGGGTGAEVLIIGTGGKAESAAYQVLPHLVEGGNWANRGVKVQNILVLRDTTMPAILTENGFIDNIIDAGKLKETDFRQTLAVVHAKGICDYFGIQYQEPLQPTPSVMYRVILDGKQTIALSFQEKAIFEVKNAVDGGLASEGVVQRTTDNVIVYEYKSSGNISKTPIMGEETIIVEQCRQFLLNYNPDAPDIISYYKIHGERLGIKWGYAVAQMIRETGYLKFTGVVKAEQNNYAGIGAVGEGAQGATFSSESEGVLAHLEHLYAYAVKDPLPMGVPKVDPRFDLIERGSCPNWEDLNGRWAVPGDGYGENVVRIYHEMAQEIISDNEEISILKMIYEIVSKYFDGK
ncbi:N-acetylmuramoyl-L-alanine amidase [Desulfosporosinus orientis DSM 765]|uniref:N-acetylmuramoyl-L-alanine amidase n=1 Tax=Desulfosporosinus orientis (strain ATCC 19365 / DSM 765 / NCIMB 8382 / VKM B-1628 / Singapore I) TaxID=768706 RepID=G7WA27_DESOD|nr:N-acetylmuramoyl-L-alanine amidase [Desulfosporosinus orientis]AET66023.1 N-acetylmuramoyl-L-alanine amidase [Desulfosporosinus orientis DSM 765]